MERFWSRVDKSGDCWVWTGGRVRPGSYGKLKFGGRKVFAHRLSYEMAHGPIPPGMVVMHSCDNPACVKPEHLSIGTQADNMMDAISKGRALGGGVTHLSDDQVREMRAIGWMYSTRELARMFGVDHGYVGHILRGTKRRNVV